MSWPQIALLLDEPNKQKVHYRYGRASREPELGSLLFKVHQDLDVARVANLKLSAASGEGRVDHQE